VIITFYIESENEKEMTVMIANESLLKMVYKLVMKIMVCILLNEILLSVKKT
jgi:hypothetical protein